MADINLKDTIQEHMKQAMKAKDPKRLGIIRLIMAAIKQVEIDSQKKLDDTDVLAILNKMMKQRRDAKEQYEKANREDLATQEAFEISVIKAYLPEQLSAEALHSLIEECIKTAGASGPQDMGKVMGLIKPKVQGRADMRQVSEQIKKMLQS